MPDAMNPLGPSIGQRRFFPARSQSERALWEREEAHFASEGYDPVDGARPLKRAIQGSVLDPLSLEILAGRFREGGVITADAVEGKVVLVK